METTPAQQLAEIQRLRRTASVEAERGPRGALVVLFIASLVFFGSFVVGNDTTHAISFGVWTVFAAAWVLWHRSASRVRLGQPTRSGREWRREMAERAGYALLGFGFVMLGANVSWPLAGALFALLSTVAGAVAVLRSVRAVKP